MEQCWVYILCSKPYGTLYVGFTNNLANRVAQHKKKVVDGFTSRYNVKILVYFEIYNNIIEARQREHSLKRWHRSWKIRLIEQSNPEWNDLSDLL